MKKQLFKDHTHNKYFHKNTGLCCVVLYNFSPFRRDLLLPSSKKFSLKCIIANDAFVTHFYIECTQFHGISLGFTEKIGE
jgi:hypothetical protein